MMQKFKRASVWVITTVLLASQSLTVAFAATDEIQTTTEAGTKQTTVTYTEDSTFTVTIPKTIVLDTSKEATYDVKVQGDIKGNEVITVTPDSTVAMKDAKGKSDVTATITQTTTEFNAEAVNQADGTSTTGNVSAPDLTAGSWTGTLNFVIANTTK